MPTIRTSLALLAFVLSTATVQAGETVTLEQKLAKGTRAKVQVHRETEVKYVYKDWGSKVGNAETTTTHHRYTEEVRSAQPVIFWREYAEATRSKHHPHAKPKPLKTSLHGRRAYATKDGLQPDGAYEIDKDEREALKIERLLPALLPARKIVKVRDSWTVPSRKLDEALFGAEIARSNKTSTARVTLKSVKTEGDDQIATLKVKLKIHIDRTSSFPEIDLTLKGDVKWSIKASLPVSANLKGTVGFVVVHKDGEIHADGTTSYEYQAEILEIRKPKGDDDRKQGLPPPPGTRVLVCELHQEHKIDMNTFKICLLCGKKLDKDFNCPNGDPWPFQYCPHDGAPLNPAE